MKDKPKIGYYNEEGEFIEKELPKNRVKCHWSNDNIPCSFIAIKGNVFCEKHYESVMKINKRKFNINPQVNGALMRNE